MESEHLRPVLISRSDSDKFWRMGQELARAQVPDEILQAIRSGRLTALQKESGCVRGIVADCAHVSRQNHCPKKWSVRSRLPLLHSSALYRPERAVSASRISFRPLQTQTPTPQCCPSRPCSEASCRWKERCRVAVRQAILRDPIHVRHLRGVQPRARLADFQVLEFELWSIPGSKLIKGRPNSGTKAGFLLRGGRH